MMFKIDQSDYLKKQIDNLLHTLLREFLLNISFYAEKLVTLEKQEEFIAELAKTFLQTNVPKIIFDYGSTQIAQKEGTFIDNAQPSIHQDEKKELAPVVGPFQKAANDHHKSKEAESSNEAVG